ncbi:malate synthase A [Fulvivirga lutea]|uniref:Malate synthase n=1 Tax=Fulvivirga lutea TaxID=2810512 RepID=A0A974WID7_9BACT|nr:malate synthase A [Fulvivirga lutea]QSE98464.1 malate synthase A [Fulvivirga lutea]
MTTTTVKTLPKTHSIQVLGKLKTGYEEILTDEALAFVEALHKKFNATRKELLADRLIRQKRFDAGERPSFLSKTSDIRESDWSVAPVPAEIQDRRVEITGPVERKMIINALNSGAKVFMADFEDSNSPNWENVVQGQINLRDANDRTISFENPTSGKKYELNDEVAVLFVRPRGWHLEEKHIVVNGEQVSGGFVDFGLYFFHNVTTLLNRGSAPYFYLPKLENHHEARLWNDVFVFAQEYLGIPQGTIKATVLIETITAAFELEEILYVLKEHSAGLNCGRWDYIFSYIKKFRNEPGFVTPDRSQITMATPFMNAYSLAVIKACHKRGAHAMGGMAAQIPIKADPEANEKALEKVMADKVREARMGHDGTWVAHPGLVKVAESAFNKYMVTKNQIHIKRDDVGVSEKMLLEKPLGTITEQGLRTNINVGILYIESWLRGNGAAALYNLMEDAATAEISRTQVWQWLKNGAKLDDGRTINVELYEEIKNEELIKIKELVGKDNYQNGQFKKAIELFDELVLQPKFNDFLTTQAYNLID